MTAMGITNPFGKAVLYAIVLSAVAHLVVSLFYGVLHGDMDVVNMFHVLGFDLFWPNLGSGLFNATLGVLMIVVIWLAVGGTLYWRDRRADAARKAAKKHKDS